MIKAWYQKSNNMDKGKRLIKYDTMQSYMFK